MTLSDLARRLNRRCRFPADHLPPLLLLSDSDRLPDPLTALDGLAPGDGVILRHYDDPHRAVLARDLATACANKGLKLLIAGDIDLARDVGADGLHLPEYQLRALNRTVARPKPGIIVTAAAHDAGALDLAARYGIDAALLSPVFAIPSHPGSRGLGAPAFAALAAAAAVPVYALGGVTTVTAAGLPLGSCCGLAAIGGAKK